MSSRSPEIAALAAAALLLGGCVDYMSRHDAVTFRAGNAAQHNTAIHAIEPFPAPAIDTAIVTDGKKAASAVELYRTPAGERPDATNVTSE